MGRNEYTDRVLSMMRRANQGERDAIRAELEAHMEDHMACLLELGYSEELAEERTMAAMGDPEEVGRELDKQYGSRFWTLLEGIAVFTLIAVIFQAITGIGILFHAEDYLEARFMPERRLEQDSEQDGYHALATQSVDLRVPVGNDILRVYHVSVGNRVDHSPEARGEETILAAKVSLCSYDRIPFGTVSDEIWKGITLRNARGEALDRWTAGFGGSIGSYGADYISRYVGIEPEDTYVVLEYDQYGESFSLEIPLPEVTP